MKLECNMQELVLIEGQTKQLEDALTQETTKAIKHFEHELTGIRTGRAHASMVEDIKVDCYGGTSEMPIKALGTVTAPEARLIIIQPWDQGTLMDIDRALRESDLGITPQHDGHILRIVLPEMSATRREELVKLLHRKLEECRVSIRHVRHAFHNLIRDAEKTKKISEDFAKRLTDILEKNIKKTITFIEELASKKEVALKG